MITAPCTEVWRRDHCEVPPPGRRLKQIRFLLGQASIQTTVRYIGGKQKLQDAVNDRFEIAVASDTA